MDEASVDGRFKSIYKSLEINFAGSEKSEVVQ